MIDSLWFYIVHIDYIMLIYSNARHKYIHLLNTWCDGSCKSSIRCVFVCVCVCEYTLRQRGKISFGFGFSECQKERIYISKIFVVRMLSWAGWGCNRIYEKWNKMKFKTHGINNNNHNYCRSNKNNNSDCLVNSWFGCVKEKNKVK